METSAIECSATEKIEEPKYRELTISVDSPLFEVFSKIIKQVKFNEKEKEVSVINQLRSQKMRQQITDTFKFVFDWQNEDICSISVFEKL